MPSGAQRLDFFEPLFRGFAYRPLPHRLPRSAQYQGPLRSPLRSDLDTGTHLAWLLGGAATLLSYYYCWADKDGKHKRYIKAEKLAQVQQMVRDRKRIQEILHILAPEISVP